MPIRLDDARKWSSRVWISLKTKTRMVKFGVADASANELTIDREIRVQPNPEIARLPNWVAAPVAAGGLAVALAKASGLLLVISSAISHDLIKKQIKKSISEHWELMFVRLAARAAVILAEHFGVNPPDYVAATFEFAFGFAASSFFCVIIMGIFNKRMNKERAIAGMIAGH